MASKLTGETVVQLLMDKIAELECPELQVHDSPGFRRWRTEVEAILRNFFGDKSHQLRNFRDASIASHPVYMNEDKESRRKRAQAAHEKMLPNAKAALEAIIFEVKVFAIPTPSVQFTELSEDSVRIKDMKAELEQFLKRFVRYKEFAMAEKSGIAVVPGLEPLRLELQRKYGKLKAVIEEYGDSTEVLLEGGKRECEAFTSAFSYTQFSRGALDVVMDTAISAINIAIGNLESLTLPETGQMGAPQETVFPSGKTYDAYKAIMGIITTATKKLIIVDSYVDSTLFTMLENVQPKVQIQILTQSMKGDFQLAGQKFKEQREKDQQATLEIRKSGKFHDRFIVADGKVFHIGASIKDAGAKVCFMSEVEMADIKTTLKEAISAYWDEAEIVL